MGLNYLEKEAQKGQIISSKQSFPEHFLRWSV